MKAQKVRLRVRTYNTTGPDGFMYIVLCSGVVAALGFAGRRKGAYLYGFQAAERVAKEEHLKRLRAAE